MVKGINLIGIYLLFNKDFINKQLYYNSGFKYDNNFIKELLLKINNSVTHFK